MQRVFGFFNSLDPLAKHSVCCVARYEWAELSKGFLLVAVEPRTTAAREHLSASGGKLLPSANNPRVLTHDEAALFPANFGVGAADTVFSAMQKASQVMGHTGLDPEL